MLKNEAYKLTIIYHNCRFCPSYIKLVLHIQKIYILIGYVTLFLYLINLPSNNIGHRNLLIPIWLLFLSGILKGWQPIYDTSNSFMRWYFIVHWICFWSQFKLKSSILVKPQRHSSVCKCYKMKNTALRLFYSKYLFPK